MDRFEVEALVIGAGVVGLAVARRLAMAGREVLVLEKNGAIGMETSARNSEVIHAGLYYPKGSIKAEACRKGRDLLYGYAADHGVAHRQCGKIVLATAPDQHETLAALYAKAEANGVPGLAWLTEKDVADMEPEVSCTRAFHSPITGIVDSHGLMLALQGDLENHGGQIAFHTPASAIAPENDRLIVTTGGETDAEIEARLVVNCAGHGAPVLAASTTGLGPDHRPQQWFAKGNYFSLHGKQPFSRLIYPLPEKAGLGIHATIDLQGRCRFGPDVEWVDSLDDLTVSSERAALFYPAIRRYWPGLQDGFLQPDYAGMRPKLHGPDQPMPDFRIDGPQAHGIKGLVNLFGVESPGLTSALALAEMVADQC
ncbi:NAD(P)/FAD-dependent oxidoreductase [Allorhizobium sp. BGMRC 0089]|uniref:NAD(P)/FAD-dependent oxidoreductase n=1 Tax=Allorhizobium sonneratiae TaxID=2934936 RepID=UPI0020336DCF|nr:NAD(P)/FAD-dependent oxidoreductase [Allorhizobium sonneratiae]MCM2292238.1 NAD(P)/FAD-dependent oxidoreductase [Allorhizobium sonneratiae]